MPNSGITIWGNNTLTQISDLSDYGCNMETYLTDILTEELSKEIDKQIIETLMNDPIWKEERARIILREERNKKIQEIFGDDFTV
jgi:hypothetical protein